MNPASSGGDALASLTDATGLSISAADLAMSTGTGCDDPFAFEPERAIGVLATAIRRVHSQTYGPFALEAERTVAPADLVAQARAQLDLPEVEQSELSPAYAHMRREELVAVLDGRSTLIAERSTGLVLNQGIPTLANLRFRGIDLLGFADWSRSALADPHLDLAIACRDLMRRFGAPPVREFLETISNGSHDPAQPNEGDRDRPQSDRLRLDPVRLDWYTLAIELGS